MPKNPQIHKVLVIGSGPIVIGQAAEFDYAGTQACRALREHEMAALREAADELEELVPQTYWPMPDYCELLFDL